MHDIFDKSKLDQIISDYTRNTKVFSRILSKDFDDQKERPIFFGQVPEDSEERCLSLLSFDEAAQDKSRTELDSRQGEENYGKNFVVGQAFDFISWGVDGKRVILKSRQGRILFEVLNIEVSDLAGSGVVEITYVPNRIKGDLLSSEVGCNKVVVFRMYKSSLTSLSEILRNNLDQMVLFDEIYNV